MGRLRCVRNVVEDTRSPPPVSPPCVRSTKGTGPSLSTAWPQVVSKIHDGIPTVSLVCECLVPPLSCVPGLGVPVPLFLYSLVSAEDRSTAPPSRCPSSRPYPDVPTPLPWPSHTPVSTKPTSHPSERLQPHRVQTFLELGIRLSDDFPPRLGSPCT